MTIRALILALLISTWLLAGCGGPIGMMPDAAQIDALAKDTATVCVFGQVVYGPGAGSLTVARTNINGGNLKCGKDGLELTSAPPGIGLPITITPQFRLESPFMPTPPGEHPPRVPR